MGFTINSGNSLCEASNSSAVVFTLDPQKFLFWSLQQLMGESSEPQGAAGSLLQQDTGGFGFPGSKRFALYIKDIVREKRMGEKREK